MEINEFKDRLFGRRFTRRALHRAMASFGVFSMAIPYVSRSPLAVGDDQPVFFTWGGYDDDAFIKPYLERYGTGPNYSLFGDEEEAFNKMRAGFEPDMMFPCSYKVPLWRDAGLLAPIDTSLLSNWPDVVEPLKNLPGSVYDGKRYFVPEDWGQTSVLFRGDLAPEYVDPANHTWGIMWDEKYAGRLGHFDSINDNVVVAAVYAGVDPFRMSPTDLEKVRALLQKQLPLLRFMLNDTTSLAQAIVSGEVIASVAWNSMIWRTAEGGGQEGAEYVWMVPKEGRITWVCGLTIHPKAVEHGMYERCHEVIDAYLSPESGFYEVTNWYFGHANGKVYDMVDEATLEGAGLAKDVATFLASGVFIEPMSNEAEVAQMWEEVKAGA